MHTSRDRGLTLIELIIAMTISGIIVGVLGVALQTSFRHDADTKARYTTANNALFATNYFTSDLASTPANRRDANAAAASGCAGADPAGSRNVLLLTWSEQATTYRVSYRIGNVDGRGRLWRVACTNFGAARQSVVARNLLAMPGGWSGGAPPVQLNGTITDPTLRLVVTPEGGELPAYTIGGASMNPESTLPPVVTVAPQPQILAQIVGTAPASFAPGETVTVTVELSNVGARPLSGVGVTFSAGTTSAGCSSSTLSIGATATCTGQHVTTYAEFDAGTPILVTATGSANYGAAVVTSADDAEIATNASAGVTAILTSQTLSYTNVGDFIDYRYEITNTGTVRITDVDITHDNAVAGLCTTPPINPGATMVCVARHVVTATEVPPPPVPPATAGSAQVVNTANVVAHTANFGDVTASPSSVTVPYSSAPILVAKLEITDLVASPSPFDVRNQVITYTVTLKNTGNVALTNVTASHSAAAGTCTPMTLNPNATRTCTATHTTTDAEASAGATNTVSAVGTASQCASSGSACTPAQSISVPTSVPCDVTTSETAVIGSPSPVSTVGGNPKYLSQNVTLTVNTVGVCAGLRVRYYPDTTSSVEASMTNPSANTWSFVVPGTGVSGASPWKKNSWARVEVLLPDAGSTVIYNNAVAFRVS